MASTTPTNVVESIPEVWALRVLRDTLRMGYWAKFAGPEGSGMPLIRKTELLNKPGDLIHITTTAPLAAAGVSGDTTALEGSEEALDTGELQVAPELYRHAVRWYKRANKKSIMSLREEARLRLREHASERMDDVRFSQFVSTDEADVPDATYTPNQFFCGASSSSIVTVGAGDDIDVATLQKISLKLYNQRAKPIRTSGGEEFYAMVMHPNCAYQLKQDTRYEQWAREARERGQSNPLFTGALLVIDGMILYQHSNVPVLAAGGEAGIDVAQNIAFGAEAFVEGVDEVVSWDEDTFDYGNEFGIAYRFAFQPRRGLEKNSVVVYADGEPIAGV